MSRRNSRLLSTVLAAVTVAGWGFTPLARAQLQVKVVNVIPNSMSSETDQNSEPSIAVNPANPADIVVSAFSNAVTNSPPGLSPYFTSFNGGTTFTVFPQDNLQQPDTTLAWSPTPGNAFGTLYAARLFPNAATGIGNIDVVKDTGAGLSTGGVPNTIPGSSYNPPGGSIGNDVDQPRIALSSNGTIDRLYVGFNDLSKAGNLVGQTGATASIQFTPNAALNNPVWNPVTGAPLVLDRNPGVGQIQDGPAVPVAASPNSSTVYAAFERWSGAAAAGSGDQNAQIIVMKDTANGTNNFGDLGAKVNVPGLGLVGQGVNVLGGAAQVVIPQSLGGLGTGTSLGMERLGSDLSLAVSPTNANIVYVAYAQVIKGISEVTVQMSGNGGLNFPTSFTVPANSGLPALAVAQNGVVGLLDTALVGGNLVTQMWELNGTTLVPFMLKAKHPELDLSSFPNGNPAVAFQPYIGDYEGLIAVGNQFEGTFSASNSPILNTFPDDSSVIFQRNLAVAFPGGVTGSLANLDLKHLPPTAMVTGLADNNGNPLNITSIDPYIFNVASVPEPSTLTMAFISVAAGLAWALVRRIKILL
jgi:hypothetical protein